MTIIDTLRQVDLAFVVDTTGSMGPFIQAAQQQMIQVLQAIVNAYDIPLDLRVGIVEYRDHPPQEQSFVYRSYDFRESLKQVQQMINELKPNGGGDAPEAVYDGLQAACETLEWRPHSRRLAMLIGDAPPHTRCPCGQTADSVTAALEQKGVILYTLGLTPGLQNSFADLAQRTGGKYFQAGQGEAALATLQATLQAEFKDLAFDARVLELCQQSPWTVEALCQTLESSISLISASLSRLGRRGLL
jgi:Mg-chelatase subunit ChlD